MPILYVGNEVREEQEAVRARRPQEWRRKKVPSAVRPNRSDAVCSKETIELKLREFLARAEELKEFLNKPKAPKKKAGKTVRQSSPIKCGAGHF